MGGGKGHGRQRAGGRRPRVVVVGGGFAGFHAARTASRRARDDVEIALLNPTDYFLYLPLLPEVAAGVLEPRRITVSLAAALPGVRLVLGEADGRRPRRPHRSATPTPRAERGQHRLRPAGARRRQRQQAAADPRGGRARARLPRASRRRSTCATTSSGRSSWPRRPTTRPSGSARTTFVVVGAGYTGTEVAAHGAAVHRPLWPERRPRLAGPAALDAARHGRPGAARARPAAVAHGRPGAARGAASRCGWAPRSRRPPPTGCG